MSVLEGVIQKFYLVVAVTSREVIYLDLRVLSTPASLYHDLFPTCSMSLSLRFQAFKEHFQAILKSSGKTQSMSNSCILRVGRTQGLQ